MKKTNQLRGNLGNKKQLLVSLFAVFAVLIGSLLFFTPNSQASLPSLGTLNTTGPDVNWTGTGTGIPPAAMGESDCYASTAGIPNEGRSCDTFVLMLGGTSPSDWAGKRARINIHWTSPTSDYDLFIHTGSNSGPIVGESAGGPTTFEQTELDPVALNTLGPFYVHVVYFATPASADQYQGTASAVAGPPPSQTPPPSTCIIPTYQSTKPDSSVVGFDQAGEPSIGVNWNTGNVLFQSYLYTLRATFNDATSPAGVNWVSRQGPNQQQSLDPIGYTDSATGRTFANQLLAVGGSSLTAFTDNDGESFSNTITAPITSGADHQTLGAGPFKPGIIGREPTTSYPNAVYYASQNIAEASAALSLDGGTTFLPATIMYNLNQCSGLHGHVKVAPDGTVYVPNKNCPGGDNGAGQGFAISEDNGLTWHVRVLPGSGSGDNDPSIGIGAGGRIYLAYTSGNKHMRVAVSDDKGLTWKYDQDIGVGFNIQASVFPAAVAGDNNRASVFFHGTDSTMGGDPTGDDTAGVFAGTWYPYLATTCNGGQSWSVVRADDPVQQGVICTSGTTCPSGTRNLLDFMDITVDRAGRVLAGYADGCINGPCLSAVDGTKAVNDKEQIATILRQKGGSRLFSEFDAGGPAAPPLPPPVDVATTRTGNRLSWQTPDDNGSPLTSYRIYRGVGDGKPILIGEVNAEAHSFKDKKVRRNSVYYQVTAANSYGESPRTTKFFANDSLKFARGE